MNKLAAIRSGKWKPSMGNPNSFLKDMLRSRHITPLDYKRTMTTLNGGKYSNDFHVDEYGKTINAPQPVLRGTRNPNVAAAAKRGIAVHKSYDWGPGFAKEVKIPGTNMRADGVNFEKGIVGELKPDNIGAVQRGLRQLAKEKQALDKAFPEVNWQMRLDTYD